MSNITNLSVAQLKRAVQIKEQIEKLQRDLSATLGSSSPAQKPAISSGMSEATKAKLRAAAKKRWANFKAGKQASSPAAKSTGRKPMSAAARARLSALMKAKWVAKNKGSKQPVKKAAPKKPTISAAGKAKLSALAKARWAKLKAAGKKSF